MIPEEKTQLLCINFSRRFLKICTNPKMFCTKNRRKLVKAEMISVELVSRK